MFSVCFKFLFYLSSAEVMTQLIRSHRQRAAHSCTAEPDYLSKQTAALKRKADAQAVLAQHFPDQVGKNLPKPPAPRDTTRLPPPANDTPPPQAAEPSKPEPAKRSKAEKLWDLKMMKLRQGAVRLEGAGEASAAERRYFEWCVDLAGEGVALWRRGGKFRTTHKVWVPLVGRSYACRRG